MTSLFIAPLILFASHSIESPKEITLQEAMANNLVEVSIESVGGYSGKCVALHVNSDSRKKFNLIVEPGDLFISEFDENQNILVVEEQVLAMEDVEDDFRIEGFCCEAHDSSPGEGDGFTLTKVKNEKLAKLANYISGKGVDLDNKQSAIWAVSDGNSVSDIYPTNKASKPLRKYVCELTGQKDVWFNTKKNYHVTESRQIVSEPVLITGEVKYDVKEPGKVYCSVYDSEGNVMLELVKGTQIPYAADLSFEFQGKVKGWDEGDYFVKVFLDEKEIHSQKFTV
ncbi:hypothetical protein [Parvicella tangerina]|uniref:Uncharacterized protein n=1 Tax=Parvicella tangerina TaxID=2829795 RepID=A0A916JL71_9FLAO|nr:hypothetical protein [Parvicella tangerina]CAG5078354.1 hypothetical protein CRYO30217_00649 [Parvicella tangerina]